jgi:hypothetical protein
MDKGVRVLGCKWGQGCSNLYSVKELYAWFCQFNSQVIRCWQGSKERPSWDVYLPLLFDSFMSMVSRFGNKAHFKTVIGLFPVFSLRWEFYLCEPHMSGYRFLKLSRWVSFGWKRWHTMPFCLRYSSDLMVTAHQECVCVRTTGCSL